MIATSPLFLKKIMTLIIFSLFFSFLSTLFDLSPIEGMSQGSTILIIFIGFCFIGLIYFLFIYLYYKKKNAARIVFVILLILGILASIFSLITENYSIAQIIFELSAIGLDIYTLILLLGAQANQYINSTNTRYDLNGNYKAWFSTLSSILFVIMIGAKFLNKNEINHQNSQNFSTTDNQSNNDFIESSDTTTETNNTDTNSLESESNSSVNRVAEPTNPYFEKLDCKDSTMISEFTDTMNNSPSALSNNIKVIDIDTDYIQEISYEPNPYELKCSVKLTLNDSSEVNYIMRVYDKNGKGKMMIEGIPAETGL